VFVCVVSVCGVCVCVCVRARGMRSRPHANEDC